MRNKPLIIISTVFLLLNGCKPDLKSKAEENIKKYISENINDPKGYEVVRFGELKSDSTMMDEEKKYKMYDDSVTTAQSERDDLRHKYLMNEISYLDYLKLSSSYSQKAIDILDRKLKWMNLYKPMPCGFSIMHIYRKKNSKGGTVLDSMCFRLDSNSVIKQKKYYALINDDK